MNKKYLLAYIVGFLLFAGTVASLFAPFLGEILGMCGLIIPLFIFIAVLFKSMAERGY